MSNEQRFTDKDVMIPKSVENKMDEITNRIYQGIFSGATERAKKRVLRSSDPTLRKAWINADDVEKAAIEDCESMLRTCSQ